MNKDQLHTVREGATVLRQAAFRVIDRTQEQPATQLLAIALALVAACEGSNVNVRDLLVTVERMKSDLDGPYVSTFNGIREYAKHEIGRRR
jgi:hypothetical protein